MRKVTRIERCFADLKSRGRKGFIAYVTGGDPSPRETEEIVLSLEDAGVDIVELGVPFSDPLADGPVNQAAAERALAAGTTFAGLLETVARIRARSNIPILFFSYLNPLLAHGFEREVRRSARAGVDGFLILDLPVEESASYHRVMERAGLNHICLVAPTSTDERIRRIVETATGFVYCVSREGVTGMQRAVQEGAPMLVERTRRYTDLPVALGFGVSTPAQARAVAGFADAVVVGSAIVQRFHDAGRTARGRRDAARWVRGLVRAVKEV